MSTTFKQFEVQSLSTYAPEVSDQIWEQAHFAEREVLLGTVASQAARARTTQEQQTPWSVEEVHTYTRWGDLDEYKSVRQDPNRAVGDRLTRDQSYYDPRITFAQVEVHDRERNASSMEVAGVLYTAGNVSGSPWERAIKLRGTKKNYVWLGMAAVRPAYQGVGLGKELVRTALERVVEEDFSDRERPVSAYVWTGGPRQPLLKAGFVPNPAGTQESWPFGKDGRSVPIERLAAPSVGAVLLSLGSRHEPEPQD
jgi:ribosomal protein S18 acetylase RimI-like enzyme